MRGVRRSGLYFTSKFTQPSPLGQNKKPRRKRATSNRPPWSAHVVAGFPGVALLPSSSFANGVVLSAGGGPGPSPAAWPGGPSPRLSVLSPPPFAVTLAPNGQVSLLSQGRGDVCVLYPRPVLDLVSSRYLVQRQVTPVQRRHVGTQTGAEDARGAGGGDAPGKGAVSVPCHSLLGLFRCLGS